MGKLIIYITETDQNWLKGLEYFVEEYELEYKVLQYKSVEEVLELSSLNSKEIYAIILDWELPSNGLIKEEAITNLELGFPFIPIMAFSDLEFQENVHTSIFKNKLTTNPEKLFNEIQTFIYYYKKEWLKIPVNNIFYSVQVLTSNNEIIHNYINYLFQNETPIVSRLKAIDFFRKNDRSFQITLYAVNVKNSLDSINEGNIVGLLHIYSGALLEREINANLYTEYQLYTNNNFSIEYEKQIIHVPDSKFSFYVLSGIVDDSGKTILN